jgi:hypothetical protein
MEWPNLMMGCLGRVVEKALAALHADRPLLIAAGFSHCGAEPG